MKIIDEAIGKGQTALSEFESKQLLASYRIPVTREALVENEENLIKTADDIGYPIVIKACSPDISHKTENGLICVDIRNDYEAKVAFNEIIAGMNGN